MSQPPIIDVDRGIQLAANSQSLYIQLLTTFVNQYEESATQLRAHFQNQSYQDALQVAHTMKGVASTLGITQLGETAKEMQNALKQEEPQVAESLMDDYEKQLIQALAEARVLISSQS
ncbi:Hpt domain-containing protein [Algicola sagamiensis]|uniref:Hpt domain-containing protein n=1 Tax=Algicola sagamiensis TaxID=163869 RepID=UPI0003820F6D|nr:Hpt domain-containing protein [Algicola sagamiensis]